MMLPERLILHFLAGYGSFPFSTPSLELTPLSQGSWGGSGTRKQQPKPHLIKKIAGVDPTSRADFKKSHVIISEKRDKKAAKYLVKDLPYPYTSKAQFERSMDTPLGTEWNTRVGFQRATLPKVVKKVSPRASSHSF
jgi:U3 small nucleolar RNA-associated protein 14